MDYKLPTQEEFYALERQARLMRSQETARLARAAVAAAKQYLARAFAARPAKDMRHA